MQPFLSESLQYQYERWCARYDYDPDESRSRDDFMVYLENRAVLERLASLEGRALVDSVAAQEVQS